MRLCDTPTKMNLEQTVSIDVPLLQKKKVRGIKLTAQCPACFASGADTTGNHFFLDLASGKFGCVANEGDSQHRKEIFALVGLKGPPREYTKAEKREYARLKYREETAIKARQQLTQRAQKGVANIRRKYRWSKADVFYSSPVVPDNDLVVYDPRYFLRTLFSPPDLLWNGETWQSGEQGLGRFRTASEWQEAELADLGPMTTPATWSDSVTSRTAENVLAAPYHVLDFDELDGVKPTTEADKSALVTHALAVTRWLVTKRGSRLAAIVHSGNKSLHVWLESDSIAADELQDAHKVLGIDAGLVGHPAHPCRLPGQVHEKSGERSRVLWLKEPTW